MPRTASESKSRKRHIVWLVLLAGLLGGLFWDGSPLGTWALHQALRMKFPLVRQVTPAELVTWMQDPKRPPPLLVDARTLAEFQHSHLQGAVHLDPSAGDLTPLQRIPYEQAVVVYDAAGVGGTAMVIALSRAGYRRLSNLDGGIFGWVNQGHPVVTDVGEAHTVTPVSWSWGRLLKARYRP
jgi:rhodanese-related sulfurtransferase